MLRRKDKSMSTDGAWELLARAPCVHLAGQSPDGRPILRTVNAVVWPCTVGRRGLAFHGAMAGEKLELLGQPVVAQAEDVVATIPSVWQHPERACPATEWYRSAQVRGRLVSVEDLDQKAEVLQAIMTRFQPEGGFRPITAGDPLYAAAVRGILIAHVEVEELCGKLAVGQNLAPAARRAVLDGLWRRGAPGDLRAIDLCLEAAPEGEAPPSWLDAPEGARLRVWLEEARIPEIVALARDTYWNTVFAESTLARAQRGATAWVGAEDAEGRLIATARAVSDGAKHGWIGDVVVHPDWRGRGLGQAVIRALLDHPNLRDTRHVALKTRDAMSFYARFGFRELRREGDRTEMLRSLPA